MGFRPEYLIPLVLLALLFLGPKRLPEVGASIGKTIREFQKSLRETSDAVSVKEPPAVTTPPNPPELAAPAQTTPTNENTPTA